MLFNEGFFLADCGGIGLHTDISFQFFMGCGGMGLNWKYVLKSLLLSMTL